MKTHQVLIPMAKREWVERTETRLSHEAALYGYREQARGTAPLESRCNTPYRAAPRKKKNMGTLFLLSNIPRIFATVYHLD